jgi:hypothetical protein
MFFGQSSSKYKNRAKTKNKPQLRLVSHRVRIKMNFQTSAVFYLLCLIVRLDSFDLQCQYEKFNGSIVSGSMCRAVNVNVTSRDETITSVNGQGPEAFDKYKFDMIEIFDETLNFIPQGFDDFFPNVHSLGIRYSKLKEVEKKNFAQFPMLYNLWIENNQIEKLPGDLFQANLQLSRVSFVANRISQVGEDLLNLNHSVYIDFIDNKCISTYGGRTYMQRVLREKCPERT